MGILAGYYGRRVDSLISSIMQILVNLPIFFLMIILSFIIHFEILSISLIIGLLNWAGMARLVRGQVQNIRNKEYIEAAQAVGSGSFRIMLRHIAPNVFPSILVMMGFDAGAAIITEAALSYLQFGVQIPVPSWGTLIAGSESGTPSLSGVAADWLFWPQLYVWLSPFCPFTLLLMDYVMLLMSNKKSRRKCSDLG